MIAISLVIATFNGAKKLPEALRSLSLQTLPKELWEVVVVNNNSTDTTAEVVGEFAAAHPDLNIRLVEESRQGLSWARNKGIEVSEGEYIAIIDDDEVACPELLEVYWEFLNSHPQVVAAGGRITPRYPAGRPSWLSKISERPIAGTLNLGEEERIFPEGKYFGGGNMCLRRTAIERYGVFDTNLGRRGNKLLGGEEKELYMRYKCSGESVYYLPKAEIYHIISPERLTKSYFKAVCFRVGQSERIRTLSNGRGAFRKRLLSEGFKWGATFAIGFAHCLALQFPKAAYLFIMRREISRGLLSAADSEK